MPQLLGPSPGIDRTRNVLIAVPDWIDTATITANKSPETGTVLTDLVTRQPSDCVGFPVSGGSLVVSAVRAARTELDVVSVLRANATTAATWSVGLGDSATEAAGTHAYDATGNGNHGTLTNGAFVAGHLYGALALEGDGKIVSASVTTSGTGVTFCAWVRVDALDADRVLFDHGGTAIYAEVLSTGAIQLNGDTGTVTTGVLVPGYWTHVAIVLESVDGVRIYLDGVLDVDTTSSGSTIGGTGAWHIGDYVSPGSDTGWLGALDDVRVYARPLTGSEVQAAMAAEAAAPFDADLRFYYRLNGYQSGSLTFGAPPNDATATLRDAFLLLPYRMTNTHLRVEIADATNTTALRIGRFLAGKAWQSSHNFDWGYAFGAATETKKTQTPSGAVLSVERPVQPQFTATIKHLPQTEAFAEAYRLRALLGTAGELLLCTDPGDEAYLQAQLIYGQFAELPTIAPDYYDGWSVTLDVEALG